MTAVDEDKLTSLAKFHPTTYQHQWIRLHVTDKELLTTLSSERTRASQTYPIEKFPCLIYTNDYDESANRIKVWLKEEETQVDKCSDYMNGNFSANKMQDCWVCKWIEIDPLWLVDLTEQIDETTIEKSDFYRLHGDRTVHYGDGGEDFLVYPVWIQEYLPISEKRRQRLLDVLHELNNQRQDFHESPSPVEDIIDPDLLISPPKTTFNRDQWIAQELKRKEAIGSREARQFKRDIIDGDYTDLSDHEKIRSTYQWLPSNFIIDDNGKVDILTPIHQLPLLAQYRETYGDIARIFHAMIPMFKKLKLIQDNTPNVKQRLQVIIKAQSYNLKAGMKYAGRWHTEGHTENIVAVGVYYLHIDDELEGGTLKFRPKCGPQEWYAGIKTDYEVTSVKSGTCVVFSNCIPHRFRQIRNLTRDDGRRRTFLNFFIVDPDQPIEINRKELVLASRDTISNILQQWNDGRLPNVVLEKILSILNRSMWKNVMEAKQFRQTVRQAMLNERNGWGWICWGNCGTTEFVRALSAWAPRSRTEVADTLNHTESE